jgi:hypothetical protein
MKHTTKTLRIGLVTALGLAFFLTGCGVTLSPVKRKSLEISPLQTALVPSPQTFQIVFTRTLPNAPLAETVWDNHVGAFADVKEAKRIGFTQDYTYPLLYGTAAMMKPSYTHIFIPFGRIFEGVFTSGMQKTFPQSPAPIEASNETTNAAPTEKGSHVVRLKVVNFQVWEHPLNHINMKAMVECRWLSVNITNQTDVIYVAKHELLNQSLGTLPTSGSMVRKLETFANCIAANLSEDILEHLQNLPASLK